MTTQTEALKMALEELENCADLLKVFEAPVDSCIGAAMLGAENAVTAIKEALANHIEDNLTMVAQPEQEYQFGVYSAEDLDKAWKSGYDNCKAQSLWTLEDVKKAWKRGYAAAKKEQRQARVGIYTTPSQRPSRSDIKPLTDEQIDDIYYCVEGGATALETWREQARAIEAAHGIRPTDFKE